MCDDDMGDLYDEYREHKNEMRTARTLANMKAIQESGIPFLSHNDYQTLLFREAGKPKCDFYPGTGRWRLAQKNRTLRGGAKAFLAWYQKQGAE